MTGTVLAQSANIQAGAITKERLTYLKAGTDPIPIRYLYTNVKTAVGNSDS